MTKLYIFLLYLELIVHKKLFYVSSCTFSLMLLYFFQHSSVLQWTHIKGDRRNLDDDQLRCAWKKGDVLSGNRQTDIDIKRDR